MPAKQTLKKPNLKEIGIPEEVYCDIYSDSFPVAKDE